MKTTEVAAAWQVELANTAECGEFTNSRELVRMRTQGCSSILCGKTLRMGFFAKIAIAMFINSTPLELTFVQV